MSVKHVGARVPLTPEEQRKKYGLGTLISSVVTPVAAKFGAPCVDQETGKLKIDSPCAGRVQWLNDKVPDVLNPFASTS